jgi:hypothetical protein
VWKGYATICRTHESPRYASNMEDHADIPAARKNQRQNIALARMAQIR